MLLSHCQPDIPSLGIGVVVTSCDGVNLTVVVLLFHNHIPYYSYSNYQWLGSTRTILQSLRVIRLC